MKEEVNIMKKKHGRKMKTKKNTKHKLRNKMKD